MTDEKDQAAELHEYLKKKLGHGWRLETWRKKYVARIRVYGLDMCLIAVDGFCSVRWYVENQSQNAPDLIFRSDKQMEKFLALGMKLPEHAAENKARERKEKERASRATEIRERLERKNVRQTLRMQAKLLPLSEEINRHSWNVFIRPLLFVKYENGVVVVFHEQAEWVSDNYAELISEALGAPVRIVSEP